jgi:hypothetical protein
VHEGRVFVFKESKVKAAFSYFNNILGMPPVCFSTINLDLLDLPHPNPVGMCERFTEEDIWLVIHSLPPDKTPGLDSLTARFLQVAWEIIRLDLMVAMETFWCIDTGDMIATNDAFMILLPKSAEAAIVKDYHSISLIHEDWITGTWQ